MAKDRSDYNRQAGKLGISQPTNPFEDWQNQNDEAQGVDESDEEYKRRMRIKKNKELEKEDLP